MKAGDKITCGKCGGVFTPSTSAAHRLRNERVSVLYCSLSCASKSWVRPQRQTKEEIKKRRAAYYRKNKERIKESCNIYYHNNKQRCAEASRRWVVNNPERIKQMRIRANKKEEAEKKQRRAGNRCVMCDRKLFDMSANAKVCHGECRELLDKLTCSRRRYGDYAEAHRALCQTTNILKEKRDGT